MAIDIKAELDRGVSPREVHEQVIKDQRETVTAEVVEGKWRCPRCGEPLKLESKSITLYCDRHKEEPS